MTEPVYMALEAGDPAPHFSQACLNGDFNLSNLGGGLTVLAIFMSSAGGVGKALLEIVRRGPHLFGNARFLAVTVDRGDAARLKDQVWTSFWISTARWRGAMAPFRRRRRRKVHRSSFVPALSCWTDACGCCAPSSCAPMAAMREPSCR